MTSMPAADRGPEPSTALDPERLLEPLAGDRPAGESLRYEGTYDAIREARKEDDPSLPQGVWKTDLKKGEWERVEELCVGALAEKTKDLQVGVWLLEAWLRRHGLTGVEAGLRLLTGLCRGFWREGLYPELEGDDLEGRIAPLEWMNDKVALQLKRVLVTHGASREGRDYSWMDWERALYVAELERRGEEVAETAEGAREPDRSTILARVSLTPSEFYARLSDDLGRTEAALAELRELLDELCGKESPSLSRFNETLAAMGAFVERIRKERRDMEKAEEALVLGAEETSAPGGGDTEGEEEVLSVAGVIASRADAYRMLSLAADYLLRTEPHSPAPYLVRRAIAWGGMSLAEVLRELLHNKADLATVYEVLGLHIQPPEE